MDCRSYRGHTVPQLTPSTDPAVASRHTLKNRSLATLPFRLLRGSGAPAWRTGGSEV
jgi:hypothetical protein